jgi:SnoaL-like domain
MTTLDWVRRYEAAWRAPGTDAVRDVFAPDASYRQSPYHEPLVGFDGIATMWNPSASPRTRTSRSPPKSWRRRAIASSSSPLIAATR